MSVSLNDCKMGIIALLLLSWCLFLLHIFVCLQTINNSQSTHLTSSPRIICSRVLIISNTSIDFPQVHTIDFSLRNLSNHSARPTSNNRKTGYNHIGRHNRPIQNLHIVLDDSKLANYAVGADVDMTANKSCFNNRARTDEDMICDLERVVGELPAIESQHPVYISHSFAPDKDHDLETGVGSIPFVKLPRRSQLASSTEETIPPYCDGNRISLLLGRAASWICSQQISADDNFSLDYCLSAEDNVRGADDLGASRDFVSCVLGVC